MKTEPFTQDLPHKLTQDELISKGAELSRTLDQKGHIEAEKKAAVSGFKARIEEQDQIVRRVSECIRTGEELRPTECFERMNIAERVIETCRADTTPPQVITSRAMTPDEHQLHLDAAMANMQRQAEQRSKDDAAAIETAGELVNAATNGGKRELLALHADTTVSSSKPKKKGGAERAREKKAAAEAAAKTSFASTGKKKATKGDKAAKPAAKAKKPKKAKPVLKSERFSDGGFAV